MRVTRGRIDRVEAGVARGAMVGVVQIAIAAEALGRVLADHGVGLEAANFAHDVATQRKGVGERAVFVREEPDLACAQRMRGVYLLSATCLGQAKGADVRVAG